MVRVLKQYFNFRSSIFFITDGLLIFISAWLAIAIRFSFDKRSILNDPLIIIKAVLFTLVCQVCLSYWDLYSFKNESFKQGLVKKMIQSIGAASILLTTVSYLFPTFLIGRGVFVISLIICPLLLILWRYSYSIILEKSLLNERVIIVGSGALAKEIGNEILSNKTLGCQMVGFIDEKVVHDAPRIFNPGGIIGDYSQLMRIVLDQKVDKIIVAMPERRGILPVDELLKCKMWGIEIEDGVSFYEKTTGKIAVEELKPSWLIYSDGFKIHRSTKVTKRVLDLFLATTGLILAFPFFLVVPLLVRLDSPGPIFFRQERVGENGKNFILVKFRSMRANAEANTGPVWAQSNDSRVTRIGKFMRQTRIDELPQLFNVIKGEMSFVGPRPERPLFVEKLTKQILYYPLRHSVKPGLTGWAQVKYRYGSSVKDAFEKLQYELYYIKNSSIFLDFAIIISTIKVVLSARGAR